MNNEPVAHENTDKEIWRAIPNDYYSPSIFVTKENNIGINVGGRVSVKTVEQWHNNTHPAKTDKQVLSVVALEERLNWSRLQGSGESYIEGFQDGAEWAEQQVFNPAKTLTDIDIRNCKIYAKNEFQQMITPQAVPIQEEILDKLFAKAILRKASEK